MNSIHNNIIPVLFAVGMGISSPVYSQVHKTSEGAQKIVQNSEITKDSMDSIREIIAEFSKKIKNTPMGTGIMNEFERALINAGVEDFHSFCFMTPYGTESGVIIGGSIKVIYKKDTFKIDHI